MKLVFNKVNDETIDVFLNINQQNQPFDYGEMILKISRQLGEIFFR